MNFRAKIFFVPFCLWADINKVERQFETNL
jgi:hypothetical protein